MPLQPDPYDAPDVGRGRAEQNQGRDCGRSRTRVDHQSELEGGQRVASVMAVGSMINTNPIDQEFGHHSVNERCPIGP